MKDGRYIGIHTQVRFWLPKNRPFTELEALISHTLDIEEKKTYSINGYSKLWQWSRNKVRSFLQNLRTPKGHHRDTHQDSKRTSTGQGIVLKLNNLQSKEDREGTPKGQGKGQRRDSLKDTTIYPNSNPQPNPKETFEDFWPIYPKKKGKENALKAWLKINPDQELIEKIISALEKQKESPDWKKENGQYIPYPATWLNGKRWEDEIKNSDDDDYFKSFGDNL